MATSNKKQLLETLQQLEGKERKKFKWFLKDNILDGFNPIPTIKLENADEMDTVDKMVETYTLEGALKITVEILRKMDQNNLAERLMSKCSMGITVLLFYPKLEVKQQCSDNAAS